ncbi:cell wall metabolism sensor histidine kinase WalK [Microbacterium sp. C7(2022)]|uniref:sensor histidine kinase n=1 Tax=Microbacterium sp. C7(2022) TaxID=2992759 RepID=UPI00237A699C|nr:HAMP domain-containing sensor histidine kinase [Microbacterium sp. C7(2022)]MDE0545767.1 HAMP domain-containing histidine kinase [Microbacterium sp. C7(2022)]
MSRPPRPISARVRILGAILGVACVGLALVGSVTFIVQRERVLDEVDSRLTSQIERLRTVAEEAVPDPRATPTATDESDDAEPADESFTSEAFADLRSYLRSVVARLVPARNEASMAIIDGEVAFVPATLSGFNMADDPALIERIVAETAGGVITQGTATSGDRTIRYVAIPTSVGGDDSEGIYVRASDLGAELQPVTASLTTYIIAAIAVLVATGVVGWFVTGRLLRPIRDMRLTADAITLADLSPRLTPQGDDEIAAMSRTVNSMLDRIQGSVSVQQQLLDDVRHELKTPLTIVRGHLELMDAHDANDVELARQIGITELDRLARLVEDIDLLAAVEGESYVMRDINVGAFTARIFELVAMIPDHEWSVEQTGTGVIIGDEDRLLQAWLQLADNAAKYTPSGAPIEIGSAVTPEGARFWVRDHGPGIPPAARHRIFRRFDRAGGKRSVGGSGLGLAIVDAITKGHQGSCAVTDTVGGGATFTIHLPPGSAALPAPVRAGDVVLQREAVE